MQAWRSIHINSRAEYLPFEGEAQYSVFSKGGRLFGASQTVIRDSYRPQLVHLNRELKANRPEYARRHDKGIFQHFNDCPSVSRTLKVTIEMFRCDVLSRPLYSPDFIPLYFPLSDYHLFRFTQNHLLTSTSAPLKIFVNSSIHG